jgi:methyl-accepting chemotaxis protein
MDQIIVSPGLDGQNRKKITSNLRTVYLVMAVIVLLIAFGIFQIVIGSPLTSIAISVMGGGALVVLLMTLPAVKQTEFNRAGFMIILAIAAMIEGTLLIDPGNSWVVGPVMTLVLTQLVGQFLERHASPLGVLLAVFAGGVVVINDTIRQPTYAIVFNETVVIALVIGLYFLVRLFLTYRSFSLGAKIMLVMNGVIILVLATITAAALITFQSLTTSLIAQAGGESVLHEMSRKIVLSAGVMMIFSGGISWLITRSILNPLGQVVDLLRSVAEKGDLTEQVSITREDELGILGETVNFLVEQLKSISVQMNRVAERDLTIAFEPKSERDMMGNAFVLMIENLKTIISDVLISLKALDKTTEELSDAAANSTQAIDQITKTIQEIALGASQQNEATGRTVASVEAASKIIENVGCGAQEQARAIDKAVKMTNQINLTIQQVAGNAQTVNTEAARATESARSGSEVVKQTIEGMQAIKVKVGLSTQKVQEMGEHSKQIGSIVETIEDIASQTNLLAVNAAIEAARAGVHGKGFAVVADEVRKLAERSTNSTKEISILIHSIQNTVAEAVLAMQVGSKEVENGTALTNQAGNALEMILQAVDGVVLQSKQTSNAAGTMTVASGQLIDMMNSVSAVVEQNSAATKAMTISSNEATRSVEAIASISEQNSEAADEMSAAAGEINTQVKEVSKATLEVMKMTRSLYGVVNQFQL